MFKQSMNNEEQKIKKEDEITAPLDSQSVLQKERDEYLDGWKRAKADLMNYKKEEAERMREFAKFANETIVSDFLNVIDSFDLGILALPDGDLGKKGLEVIRAQFRDILRRHGAEILTTEKGTPFDPSKEEAVGEAESTAPPGTVAEVVRLGCTVNERVVRPIQVKISKG